MKNLEAKTNGNQESVTFKDNMMITIPNGPQSCDHSMLGEPEFEYKNPWWASVARGPARTHAQANIYWADTACSIPWMNNRINIQTTEWLEELL